MSLSKITQWSPAVFKLNTVSVIIGTRASGKTYLVKDLCYRIKDKIDSAIVFSPTESSTKEYTSFFSNFFKKSVVYSEFTEKMLQEQVDHQKKIKFNSRPNILVVLDNCSYHKNILKSWLLYDMACNSYGLKVTCIITVQHPLDVSSDLRLNSEYFFCFSANNKSYRQRLYYTYYFGYYQNFKDFDKTFMEHTQNYHCLVQDTSYTMFPKKQFYYKALFIQLLLQLKKRRELARIFLPERSFKFFQKYPGLTQYIGTKLLLYCG